MLGDILIERGYVSRQQIEETLADQDSRDRADLIPIRVERRARKEHYEVLGSSVTEPLHVSDSFLDATDFAFDLIERDDPHEVEIVRVRGDERESVWSYSREASERYRDETTRGSAELPLERAGEPPACERNRLTARVERPPAARRSRGTCRRNGGARRAHRARRAGRIRLALVTEHVRSDGEDERRW